MRDGYVATPMRAIALEAGVSVQSVNLAGPKSALLLAAFERTFAGSEGQHSLSERPEFAQILAAPSLDEALSRYVSFLAMANERAAGIWRAFVAAADADPVVRETAAQLEQRRRADMALGASFLVRYGVVDEARAGGAADVLGFLTGPAAYLYFVEDSGWTRERYEAWLRRSLERLVFDEGAVVDKID